MHVNNFLIAGKNPIKPMELFKENFNIRHVEENPSVYLRPQLTLEPEGIVKVHNEKNVKEILSKCESKCRDSSKENILLLASYHLEKDELRQFRGDEITNH